MDEVKIVRYRNLIRQLRCHLPQGGRLICVLIVPILFTTYQSRSFFIYFSQLKCAHKACFLEGYYTYTRIKILYNYYRGCGVQQNKNTSNTSFQNGRKDDFFLARVRAIFSYFFLSFIYHLISYFYSYFCMKFFHRFCEFFSLFLRNFFRNSRIFSKSR